MLSSFREHSSSAPIKGTVKGREEGVTVVEWQILGYSEVSADE